VVGEEQGLEEEEVAPPAGLPPGGTQGSAAEGHHPSWRYDPSFGLVALKVRVRP